MSPWAAVATETGLLMSAMLGAIGEDILVCVSIRFSSGWTQPARRNRGAQEVLADTVSALHSEPEGRFDRHGSLWGSPFSRTRIGTRLRLEFQASNELAVQTALAGVVPTRRKQPWPTTLPEQVRAVKDVLRATPVQRAQQVAAAFKPASRIRVAEILETLTALGQTRRLEDRYLL